MSQTNTMEYAHNAISLSLAFLTAIFQVNLGYPVLLWMVEVTVTTLF